MAIELWLTTQISKPMHVSASFSSKQLHYPGSEKGKLDCLRVNKFVCCVGIFLLTISSSPLTGSCGPLIICYGTSLLIGISQLWLHLDWLFSINVITFLLWFWHYIYVCMWLFNEYMHVVVYTHTHTHTHTHICRYTHTYNSYMYD